MIYRTGDPEARARREQARLKERLSAQDSQPAEAVASRPQGPREATRRVPGLNDEDADRLVASILEAIPAAKADIRLVQHLVGDISLYPEAVCYHCEQAVEKMLKQMWMDNGMMPRRTHDLSDLLGVACEKGWIVAMGDELAAANFLNAYATKFKYIRMRESEYGEALEAVSSLNSIAGMLDRNGYKSFSIETPAHFMHDEGVDA